MRRRLDDSTPRRKPLQPPPAQQQGNGFDHDVEWVEVEYQDIEPVEPAPRQKRVSYRPEYARIAFRMCLLGATKREIATALNTTEVTIDRWMNSPEHHPEFRTAMLNGGIRADAVVAESMYRRAIGYDHPETKVMVVDKEIHQVVTTKHLPPDTTAGTLWLTNRRRHNWRVRQSTELTGPDGAELRPPQLVVTPVSVKPNGHDTSEQH